MNSITSHEGSDILRWMSPSSWPPGGSRALGRARPNESWSTSKRFRPRATDHGDGTRCEYRSLAVRRGGCEPASSTTLIDAATRFELQCGRRIRTIGPIGHACVAVSCTRGAAQCGRVDLVGERGDRTGRGAFRCGPATHPTTEDAEDPAESRRFHRSVGRQVQEADVPVSGEILQRSEPSFRGLMENLI